MNIEEIDQALEDIQEFSGNARIKNLLTQALLILICAQFEKEIRNFITQRCASVSDEAVKNYISNHMQKSALQSLKVSDLSGLLGKFDPSYKEMFSQRISENEQVATMYGNILTNRNSVAHGRVNSATFEDVKMYYKESHVILDYFKQALCVD